MCQYRTDQRDADDAGRMGIDVSEVVRLASSKWNFTAYSPGLVGGHCIPVDPYYMISEAVPAGGLICLDQARLRHNEKHGRICGR